MDALEGLLIEVKRTQSDQSKPRTATLDRSRRDDQALGVPSVTDLH